MLPHIANSVSDGFPRQARVRVFHDAQAQGNIATCFIFDSAPSPHWRTKNSHAQGETWSLLWKDAQMVRAAALQHGNEIQFCGHALVAAGYFWFINYRALPILVTKYGKYLTRKSWGNEDFSIGVLKTQANYKSRRVTQKFKGMLHKYRGMFDIAPDGCFFVGGNNDYLLCVWPPGVDIATLNINFELIATQRRAVIVTQCNTESFAYDMAIAFEFRYFAPQYGEREGRATGSAAAIAANYWYTHLQAAAGQRFIAYQRSLTGGKIDCTVDDSTIWIGGRTDILFHQ